MTVGELIEKLREHNLEETIRLYDCEQDDEHTICEVERYQGELFLNF